MLHQVIKNKLTNKKELIPVTGLGGNNNDSIENTLRILALQDIINGGLVYNTEEVITESGEYTVPVSGYYEVTCIGGGNGGYLNSNNSYSSEAPLSGGFITKILYLEKGEKHNIVIGSGGTTTTNKDEYELVVGSSTLFGELLNSSSNDYANKWRGNLNITVTSNTNVRAVISSGCVPGSGYGYSNESANGHKYGAPGLAYFNGNITTPDSAIIYLGNGYQGAVILRYYDPAKNKGSGNNESGIITVFKDILDRLATVEEVIANGMVYNDEIWITESGNWTVPYDGYYEILAIDGGNGAYHHITNNFITAGVSGNYKQALVKFKKGQIVPIIIGTGGIGTTESTVELSTGGITTVGSVSFTQYHNNRLIPLAIQFSNIHSIRVSGAGFGGGDFLHDAYWYGAGGGGFLNSDGIYEVHDGKQGVVRFRFYNPDKNIIENEENS